MNIDEIRRIAEIMQKHDLTEFSMESEDCKMKVCRGNKNSEGAVPQHAAPVFAPPYASPHGIAHPPPGESPSSNSNQGGSKEAGGDAGAAANTIDSPIVGTFYRSPSPDSETFVKEGDEVTPETVVCIIEAMKVMNEIKAEKSGRIKKVLVENTQPVEFGQPLFELEQEI